MFTVTICSELIPQNILQLKLTYLVTFKNLLVKVVQSTYTQRFNCTYGQTDWATAHSSAGQESTPAFLHTQKKKKKK